MFSDAPSVLCACDEPDVRRSGALCGVERDRILPVVDLVRDYGVRCADRLYLCSDQKRGGGVIGGSSPWNLFHCGEWLKYSISMTCELGPEKYTSVKDLYVYAVGFGFLALYTLIGVIVLRRKDI